MFLCLLLFVFITNGLERYSIQLPVNVSATEFSLTHGLKHIKHVLGFDIFEAKTNKRYQEIEGLFRDVKKKHVKKYYRNLVTDPLFSQQWHLRSNPYAVEIDNTWSGKGINIAIVDDGVQHRHPDLHANYNPTLSYDFNGHDPDPNPKEDDGHGTSCAGVCCAVRNTICGRGVAYGASIVGIRLIGKFF